MRSKPARTLEILPANVREVRQRTGETPGLDHAQMGARLHTKAHQLISGGYPRPGRQLAHALHARSLHSRHEVYRGTRPRTLCESPSTRPKRRKNGWGLYADSGCSAASTGWFGSAILSRSPTTR
jgi:hypothetical protein